MLSFSVVFNLGVCLSLSPLTAVSPLRLFQKVAAVEEEESQVRKPTADLCSPSGKLADTDPARKVSCPSPPYIQPSIHPHKLSITSYLSAPLPLFYTQVSSQGHPTLPDTHTLFTHS